MNYTPDNWVIVEIKTQSETMRKVLAGFSGGYLYGDSWRLSSPIVAVVEHEKHYEISNESGSIYNCPKHSEGFSLITADQFEHFKERFSVVNAGIERVSL